MGSKLSGGQAQIIGIARAFYSNKKPIIVDEITSAWMKILKIKLYKNINEFDPNMTLIVISGVDLF